MADTVSTKTLFDGTKDLVVQLLNSSDGTGESAVVKVDISTLTGPNGSAPTSVAVMKIDYDIFGMNVGLFFDRTTDVKIASLAAGQGCIDYTDVGGFVGNTAGDTGDIYLTTIGHTLGDSYNIILHLRKRD